MKHLLKIALFLFVNILWGQTNNVDCKRFHSGIFTYKEKPFDKVLITRNKREQVEYDSTDGIRIEYRIKWTDNCNYQLIQTRSNNEVINKNNGSIIYVKIISADRDSYKYEADYKGVFTSYTVVKLK